MLWYHLNITSQRNTIKYAMILHGDIFLSGNIMKAVVQDYARICYINVFPRLGISFFTNIMTLHEISFAHFFM